VLPKKYDGIPNIDMNTGPALRESLLEFEAVFAGKLLAFFTRQTF